MSSSHIQDSNDNPAHVPVDSNQPTNEPEDPSNLAAVASTSRDTSTIQRPSSTTSIDTNRADNALERQSSIDFSIESLFDIFEPRTVNINNVELARPVMVELMQMKSSTDIINVEIPQGGGVIQKHTLSIHSVASYCCRFCQLGDEFEMLISPCKCKGTLAFIHYSCLTRWLNQSGRNTCELCLFRYTTIETRRYTLYQSLCIWVRHPRNRPHIKTILLITGLLTLFVFGLVLMVMLGMQHFLTEGRKLGIGPAWISGTIVIFIMLVLTVYVLTLYLLFRDQCGPWYRWWHRCINVRIVVDPGSVKPRRPNAHGYVHHGKSEARQGLHSSSNINLQENAHHVANDRPLAADNASRQQI